MKLNEQLDKLKKENIAIQLPIQGGGITHETALQMSWWTTGLFLLVLIFFFIYKHFKDSSRHKKVMRTVTDGIYGHGTYDIVRHKFHTRYECVALTSPAQVNVTLNGASIPGPSKSNERPLPPKPETRTRNNMLY